MDAYEAEKCRSCEYAYIDRSDFSAYYKCRKTNQRLTSIDKCPLDPRRINDTGDSKRKGDHEGRSKICSSL